MEKSCNNCRYATWDSVPYGSTNADYLSGCQKEDDMTEEILEGEYDCPFFEPDYEEE